MCFKNIIKEFLVIDTIWTPIKIKNLFEGMETPVMVVKNGSGDRIRTYDLRVMSPTSYHTAPPRIVLIHSYYTILAHIL